MVRMVVAATVEILPNLQQVTTRVLGSGSTAAGVGGSQPSRCTAERMLRRGGDGAYCLSPQTVCTGAVPAICSAV